MMVKTQEDMDLVGADFQIMYYIVAGITTTVFLAIVISE